MDADERGLDADQVILVDADDRVLGTTPKLEAHRAGALHRAFSVFVFDSQGDLLLQRRARTKYHSGGRWTNTCCGHPRPGEDTGLAARRRLREEMGFTCPLTPVGSFTYRAAVGGGFEEHELDHVFVGVHDGVPLPSPAEVDAWRRCALGALLAELARAPGSFTAWFGEAFAVALRAGAPPLPAALREPRS
jgi:isopentenyl-diphosphate delta-isomerase